MRIVFMGTPDFAVPSLEALIQTENVVGVICQPDRPRGRGHKLSPCPVKVLAESAGIPVFQPEKIKSPEGLARLRTFEPDLCVTAAFGQLLSRENLEVPKLGTINVHASLLPRHRGSAPVHWSILMGDQVTGVTTMMTDVGMDTGDILLMREIPIGLEDTAGTMTDRLAVTGADLLIETIRRLKAGTLKRIPQDSSLATTEPKLTRELGNLDFSKTAEELNRQVRGLSPWPGAYTTLDENVIKIGSLRGTEGEGIPGLILTANPVSGLTVACGGGAVELSEIQVPGSRMMSAREYLRGHRIETGKVLGNQDAE